MELLNPKTTNLEGAKTGVPSKKGAGNSEMEQVDDKTFTFTLVAQEPAPKFDKVNSVDDIEDMDDVTEYLDTKYQEISERIANAGTLKTKSDWEMRAEQLRAQIETSESALQAAKKSLAKVHERMRNGTSTGKTLVKNQEQVRIAERQLSELKTELLKVESILTNQTK